MKNTLKARFIVFLAVFLLGAAVGRAAQPPTALPFNNSFTVTSSNSLWQQITNAGYPTAYAAGSNDYHYFRGVFTADASTAKLAIHSDDGSRVLIDGAAAGPDNYGTDTHFTQSSSLILLPNTFTIGQEYCVEITYSNHLHTAGDKDGVTLYAYDGGGQFRTGLILSGGSDAVCVSNTMALTVSCGTPNYGWSSSAPATASVSPSGANATITGLASGSVSITATDSVSQSISRTINVVKPGISPAFLTNCVGLTNTFVLTNSAGTGAISWSQSGDLTGNGRTNKVAFSTPGTMDLTATYASCTVTAKVTVVSVSSLLPATTNFCNSGTVVYTNQTTPANFSQFVNWGGEGLFGTGSSRTNSYGSGVHIVSNWCGTSVQYSTSTVYHIDIAQTNATMLADATAPVTFYLTNSFGAATWAISPGGGPSVSGSGDTVTVNPGSVGGTYTLTACASALSSCCDTATVQIVKVTFNTNLVAFCEGTNAIVGITVAPTNFLSSLTFDTVTNVAAGSSNTVASVTVGPGNTNLTITAVSPGTATLRVRLGSSTFFGPVVKVVRVTFSTNAWYVGVGKSVTNAVDVIPADAPVTYNTKTPSIATASGSGTNVIITGVAPGTTQVQALIGNMVCAEKNVTAARVTFNPSPLYICVGQSAQSTATVDPTNVPISFLVANPAVASVTGNGNPITVMSLTNSQTYIRAVVGNAILGQLPAYGLRVEFEPKPFGVSTGQTLTVRATIYPPWLSDKVSFATYHPTTAQVVSVSMEAKPLITILGITNGLTGIAAYIGTNQLCASRNITVASLGLEYVYFDGTNRYAILKDDGSGSYEESFHWSKTTNSPLAYIRNTFPAVAARVTINPSSSPDPIIIKGDGAYRIPPTTNGAAGGAVTSPYKYALNSLPNSVNIVNPLVINWKASLDGGESFIDVGSSNNRVYTLLSTSLTANVFHTVVDVSCRNAIGQTAPADIISGIWNDFSGPIPGVLKADGTEMKYWGPFASLPANSNICFTTADLVKYADGKCGAWADFFTNTILVQGISGSVVSTITTQNKPAEGLTGVAFEVDPALAGQGNSTPAYKFLNHAVVKYGGTIYDPSYGRSYLSELAWEDASIRSLVYTNTTGGAVTNLDIKGIKETLFNP